MIRRFVNLVMENGGYGSRVYSLHRLDAAKHLFYPSTADAEAANAKEMKNNGGGGGGVDKQKPKPPRIGRLRRLPPPSLRFPTDEVDMHDTLKDMFTLLGSGGGEGRILHVGELGHGLIYDAETRSVVTAPTLDEPKGHDPVVVSIAAGAGEESSERIYVLASQAYEHSFQVLDLSQSHPRKWQPLPLPPPLLGDWSPAEIKSYTVVGYISNMTTKL